MNRLIIGVGAAILVIIGFVFIARPNNTQSNNEASTATALTGVLEAAENSFDFGSVSMAKGDVSHSFTIKNTGENPVIIGRMYTSCMCTTALLKLNGSSFGPFGMQGHGFIPKINKSLEPGEEATVEAVFDPAAHGPAGIGPIQRVIYIENNAGVPLQLNFSANVTP